MANPGEFITVWQSQHRLNFKGYREPAKVCFEKPASLPAINQEEVDQTKPLLTKEADVNGDGIPDQFRIVETKEYFLALLYRGAQYQRVWESSCGGGASGGTDETTEPEPKGQLLGAIAKKPNTKQTVTKIEWKGGRFVVSGLGVHRSFAFFPCPVSADAADDLTPKVGCCCP